MQEIEVLAGDAPARADAEIAELGRRVGGVPALHNAVEEDGADLASDSKLTHFKVSYFWCAAWPHK